MNRCIFFSQTGLIQFNLSHAVTSKAEAYNASVGFYLPAYVTFKNIISTNSTFTVYQIDSAVFFNVNEFLFY